MVQTVINWLATALQTVIAPFLWVWQLIKLWIRGRLAPRSAWAMELCVVAATVVGLGWLNWQLGLERYLAGPRTLRSVWLGLVALLCYTSVRFLMFLARTLRGRQTDFDDIRRGFHAGCDAAIDARINLQDSPLFLVLGADAEIEEAMTTSSFLGERLRITDPSLPVHWFGDAEAIWVSLPGVSAITAQVQRAKEFNYNAAKTNPDGTNIRLGIEEQEAAFQRLRYALTFLRQLRKPIVPVNGVLLLIPYRWMQDPGLAQLAESIKVDMYAAQQALGVKCTCLVIMHGIEQFPEFQAYIASTPEAGRQRRCGCTLPALAEHSTADSQPLHAWLEEFFRQQVYRFYQSDRSNQANGRLFRLLQAFKHAQEGFCRLLNNAFASDIGERFYLGGVYFAVLNQQSRVFFDGVAAKLAGDHDDAIGWNDQTLRDDRRTRRIASVVAGVVVALLTGDVVLIGRLLFG